jgi:cardiolipin synthase
MSTIVNKEYKLFDDPLQFFNAMLADIRKAKKYIYLETFRFNNDLIGVKFRDALTKKSREGVEIKLLLDSWGTSLPSHFFSDMVENGGEFRFFQKIKFFWDFFTKNHRRNHRKLLIIDDEITYVGSANLTAYSLNWRESVLRMKSGIAAKFKKAFLEQYEIYNKYVFEKLINIRKIASDDCEVIRDFPSLTKQRVRKKYLQLIKSAEKKIVIETPYFLPGYILRKALIDAVKRGVSVTIIIPKHSDVRLIDVLRNRYLGLLSKGGVNILYFTTNNLHAKLIMIDEKECSVGSANFDYRSFRYQHEIVLAFNNKSVVSQVSRHIRITLLSCVDFDYEGWSNRSPVQKFFEWVLLPLRHLL